MCVCALLWRDVGKVSRWRSRVMIRRRDSCRFTLRRTLRAQLRCQRRQRCQRVSRFAGYKYAHVDAAYSCFTPSTVIMSADESVESVRASMREAGRSAARRPMQMHMRQVHACANRVHWDAARPLPARGRIPSVARSSRRERVAGSGCLSSSAPQPTLGLELAVECPATVDHSAALACVPAHRPVSVQASACVRGVEPWGHMAAWPTRPAPPVAAGAVGSPAYVRTVFG